MKVIELHKPKTPEWLGRWVCSFCGTVIELNKDDVRRRVDYRPVSPPAVAHLYRVHCPGCNFVDERWERPVDE